MSNQKIFEMLAECEQEIFYACFDAHCDGKDDTDLKAAHAFAKQALEAFAKATGCHN